MFVALGVATLIVMLAVAATVPILQFASLGYLLEVSGRIGRTGRLRDGFIGLRPARVAGVFLGGFALVWLALRYASAMSINAQIIAPGTNAGRAWGFAAVIGIGVMIAAALGGLLIVQLFRPATYGNLRDGLWRIVTQRGPYYFWLGARGFAGGVIWLLPPVTMLVASSQIFDPTRPGLRALAVVLGLVGAFSLALVAVHLVCLQTRMAAEARFTAMFHLRGIYSRFWRSPLMFGLAVSVMLLSATPLYLLKIELVPADAAWLPSLAFVMFMFPARFLAGWAFARGSRSDRPLSNARLALRIGLCLTSGGLMLAATSFYVLIVFFSQFAGWHGIWGMYEQHAFLLPVPFLGG